MRIHFVGIGGEGMCGLAKLAILQGHVVSGSELEDKASLSELSRLGANVFRNHFAEHVQTADLVVRSSAIVPSHVEVQAAVRFGIRVMKRSECLGLLLKASGQKVIRIAGSHGKSTLTAMIGTVLRSAGLDPTIIVGAYVPSLSSHAVVGHGEYAVVESCEFDRSFLDIPGFATVVTSIEADHLDFYRGGIEEIVETFSRFVTQTELDGVTLVCSDDDRIRKKLLGLHGIKMDSYGLKSGRWRARIIGQRNNSEFTVVCDGQVFGDFRINTAGVHNVQNALAAVALASSLGVTKTDIQRGLEDYTGITRRYEVVVNYPDFKVIDDYGHTPVEMQAVFRTIRDENKDSVLVCVPCLRQFHRTKRLLEEFSSLFASANFCIVAPIVSGLGDTYESRNSVTIDDVANAVRAKGGSATTASSTEAVLTEVKNQIDIHRGKLVIILTIGSGVSKDIVEKLKVEMRS